MLNRYDPLPQQDAGEARRHREEQPRVGEVRDLMNAADRQLATITALATAMQPLPDLCQALNRFVNLNEKLLDAHTKVLQALSATQSDDFEETITVGTNIPAQRLDYHERRHMLVWTPSAQTIHLTKDGVGSVDINLNANWTVLDPPRRSQISATASNPVTLVLRYTDNVPAGLI